MIKRLDARPELHRMVASLFWLIVAAIWFSSLGIRSLIHTDEGRYATISLEMLQSGDWITPRLNGLVYFEKPALQYWAGAASFAVFGINEFAARFWPGLTGFLTVLVVWVFAAQIWGKQTGTRAALLVAGMAWMVANSHFLTLDMGASFFLTLALCSFLLAQDDRTGAQRRRWLMALCWLAMAGATLSKGLIGILIPGMTFLLYSAIERHWSIWKRMYWLTGLPIYFLLTAPWFILVSRRNPEFAHFFFIHEHVERFLTTEHGREGAIWYFVPVLLVGLFPWTSLLGAAAREGWRAPVGEFHSRRVLLIWCLFTFVFFSVSGSKLPSYILPMFPAMGMLLAISVEKVPVTAWKWHLVVPVVVFLLGICVYPFAEAAASATAPLPEWRNLMRYLAVAGVIGLAGTALTWMAFRRDHRTIGLAFMAMTSMVAIIFAMAGHNSYGQLKSTKRIVQELAPLIRPDTEVFAVQTYDQTFPFYLRRPVTLVDVRDEFALGEHVEPERWIPTLTEFEQRWTWAPSALAMMTSGTYEVLARQGLPMKIVYRDGRRLMVVKP